MSEILRQIIVGAGSLFLAPAGGIPMAELRITIPSPKASAAIGHDFAMVARDLNRAVARIEQLNQLELPFEA